MKIREFGPTEGPLSVEDSVPFLMARYGNEQKL